MIKKILITIFLILILLFFIENPKISFDFLKFSKEKIKEVGSITNKVLIETNQTNSTIKLNITNKS